MPRIIRRLSPAPPAARAPAPEPPPGIRRPYGQPRLRLQLSLGHRDTVHEAWVAITADHHTRGYSTTRYLVPQGTTIATLRAEAQSLAVLIGAHYAETIYEDRYQGLTVDGAAPPRRYAIITPSHP